MPKGIFDQKSSYAWPMNYSGINLTDVKPGRSDDLLGYAELVPGQQSKPLPNVSCGQYLATYVPRDADGLIMTFEDLAKKSNGYPMLGVLKADVDRLGLIFRYGLRGNNSLGRLVMLSRQIDFFFRGFLPAQLVTPPQDHEDFKYIYCVYTGGDDLLMVGPWTTMIKFASFLHDSFTEYTCQNPDVTISAAIAVIHAATPLARAAMEAETMLEGAKDQGRDRIGIFGEVVTWPEFNQALKDGRFLDRALSECGAEGIQVNRGFIYRLLQYYKMASDETKMQNLLWRSHLAYDIARNIKQPGIKDRKTDTPGRLRIKEMTIVRQSCPIGGNL